MNNTYVTIPDANLAAAVRKALSLGPTDPIPQKKLEELEHLDAKGSAKGRISDLTGLEKATGLNTLELHWNRIIDITPLAKLKNLTGLYINRNNIYLDVDNQIGVSDITPLTELTQLTHLHLVDNIVSDITPLSELKQLTQLSLKNNQIKNQTIIETELTMEEKKAVWLATDFILPSYKCTSKKERLEIMNNRLGIKG